MPVRAKSFLRALFLTVAVLLPAGVFAQDLPKQYSRIISVGPSITESLYALDCGHLVVGISDYCVFPPEAMEKPRVGGLLNPNLERYAALRPDLVIFRGALDKVKDYCLSRNVAVLETEMDSIEGIAETISMLGATLGKEEQAKNLNRSIQAELDAVRREAARLPRPRIFLCVGRTPGGLSSIFTCSRNSFVSQIIDIAGGENVFAAIPTAYPEISKESLVREAPDVILEMRPAENLSPSQVERLVSEWEALRTLPAVKNKRVYVMTEDCLLVPGPRVGEAARAIARRIHPSQGQEERRP